MRSDYVLITAARNEQAFIAKTIKAVLSQSILPKRWVIVSDGSTDCTDEIIIRHAEDSGLIEFVRRDTGSIEKSDFASKVLALNAGYERLKNLGYDYIGHLDADITFEPDYYGKVLKLFEQDPFLGIAGGYIFEPVQGDFLPRPYNTEKSVAGGIQLFRRECYENIGGFIPLKMGGEDTHAEVMARMKGWKVASFKEIIVYHHKIGNLVRGKIRECFRKGMAGYSIGSHPLFECVKCVRRVNEKPYLLGSFIRMLGFVWPYLSKQQRLVSNASIEYLRDEQLALLKSYLYRNFRRRLYR